MPARNICHDIVVCALTADGWTVTHDPLVLSFGGTDLFVDLGAEHPTIGAEKEGRKIAVEIRSFLNPSPVRDLEEAVGQYDIYRAVLREIEPDRLPYLAVPQRAYEGILVQRFGQLVVASLELRLLVFDEREEKVVKWMP
jgi:hypothetical protein